jgi:HEAT repeat protein
MIGIRPAEMTLEAALRDVGARDARARLQAIAALRRITSDGGDEPRRRAIAALVPLVDDTIAVVRQEALLALAELEAVEALPAAELRLDDGDAQVREAALVAIGRGVARSEGEPRARGWRILVDALGGARPELRFQAARQIVQLEAARALPLLVPLLDDGDADVRAEAAAAIGDVLVEQPPGLGETEAAAARDALARLVDADDVACPEAAFALARAGDRRALPVLLEEVRPARGEAALLAATGLWELAGRDPRALDGADARAPIEAALRRWRGDALVRVYLAGALARVGVAVGRAHLERATRAWREDVRGAARDLLGTLP